TLVYFGNVEAEEFVAAIDLKEREAENVIGSICVASANPAVPLCAFAASAGGCGLKFYAPKDRLIRHGTNVPGFLDAVPDIEKKAQSDTKFALLLRLFRASLTELDIDNQILFQLILLEEASDNEEGPFADRLRRFSERTGFRGELEIIATECGV